MTANQLKLELNNKFGMNKWPETYEVNPETYGNVCQALFDHLVNHLKIQSTTYPNIIEVCVGRTNGLMFKNVELILSDRVK